MHWSGKIGAYFFFSKKNFAKYLVVSKKILTFANVIRNESINN